MSPDQSQAVNLCQPRTEPDGKSITESNLSLRARRKEPRIGCRSGNRSRGSAAETPVLQVMRANRAERDHRPVVAGPSLRTAGRSTVC